MEKVVLVGTIVAAIIAALVVLFLISRFFNLFPGRGKDENLETEPTISEEVTEESQDEPEAFPMPNVLNLTFNDALNQIKRRSENIVVTSTEDYSDTVRPGLVIEQYPRDGTEINENTQVRLVVSAGKEAFPLPNVVNYSDSQAATVLTDANLNVSRDYQSHNGIAKGNVISTSPGANSMVVKGDTVTIIISSGPDISYVKVPQLVGLDESTARGLINASGLSAGTISEEYSDEAAGKVIFQSKTQGEDVREGTAINLVISKGPEAVATQAPTETEMPTETEAPEPITEPPEETEEETLADETSEPAAEE